MPDTSRTKDGNFINLLVHFGVITQYEVEDVRSAAATINAPAAADLVIINWLLGEKRCSLHKIQAILIIQQLDWIAVLVGGVELVKGVLSRDSRDIANKFHMQSQIIAFKRTEFTQQIDRLQKKIAYFAVQRQNLSGQLVECGKVKDALIQQSRTQTDEYKLLAAHECKLRDNLNILDETQQEAKIHKEKITAEINSYADIVAAFKIESNEFINQQAWQGMRMLTNFLASFRDYDCKDINANIEMFPNVDAKLHSLLKRVQSTKDILKVLLVQISSNIEFYKSYSAAYTLHGAGLVYRIKSALLHLLPTMKTTRLQRLRKLRENNVIATIQKDVVMLQGDCEKLRKDYEKLRTDRENGILTTALDQLELDVAKNNLEEFKNNLEAFKLSLERQLLGIKQKISEFTILEEFASLAKMVDVIINDICANKREDLDSKFTLLSKFLTEISDSLPINIADLENEKVEQEWLTICRDLQHGIINYSHEMLTKYAKNFWHETKRCLEDYPDIATSVGSSGRRVQSLLNLSSISPSPRPSPSPKGSSHLSSFSL